MTLWLNYNYLNFLLKSFYFYFAFLRPHVWHMEVPRLEVESYATTTAMPGLRRLQLHRSSWQHRMLNPLGLTKPTEIEPTSSWILVGFVTAESQQELP